MLASEPIVLVHPRMQKVRKVEHTHFVSAAAIDQLSSQLACSLAVRAAIIIIRFAPADDGKRYCV